MAGNCLLSSFTFLALFATSSKMERILDKMKEKGDACIFVGYSTQSKGYKVYNKRTRLIVETIHVNFDELPIHPRCALSLGEGAVLPNI
ncbi:hypothetical protein Tco_0423822 [Tanacetum coccineum]